ncbi:MAG TPA: hypothetical protein VJX66_07800 [Amycolatopsis sp.]|nr:hypothetical protein [Amycolatopsis sp.]
MAESVKPATQRDSDGTPTTRVTKHRPTTVMPDTTITAHDA